ncbi:MAG TPA: hypothetical protein VK988_01585 [Acidimicrobiales bacterium]|nr:hypothetical protein [Acidimicrobiales bacterium]
MSDTNEDLPGKSGTQEGEAGASESEPVAPSVEGRDTADEAEEGSQSS